MSNFIKIYNDVVNYPTIQDVADKLGIHRRTVGKKAKRFREEGVELVDRSSINVLESDVSETTDVHTQTEITKLKQQVSSLNRQLKDAHKEVSTSKVLRDLIHEINDYKLPHEPKWLTKIKSRNKNSITGIPVLFLSDIHFDEVVDREQIGGVNEFNRRIAEERIRYTFETSIKLTKEYMESPNYDGFVLALGGDLLSGNIHEELSETNEVPIIESIIRLTDIIIEGVERLHEEFGKVFIPCVVGNHGRLRQQKRYKNKVFDNYEYLVYHYVAKHFKDNNDVIVHAPSSPDTQFNIYNMRFLLEHGDAFRGGSGIAGIFSPLMMGAYKRNRNKIAVNQGFDVMMIGHFHQYVHTNSLIVNGSIKGYDEYAYGNNFPFESPQQALFIVHPTFGVTFRMPVKCDGYVLEDKDHKEKVRIVF